MNKPMSYDETQIGGYTPVNLGGHTCVIKQVSETKSKNGDDMIVVLFDFDRDDAQPNYFTNEFNGNTKECKKWPFNGTCWIMVNDFADKSKTNRNFKRFCEAVVESNTGFQIKWGEGSAWGKQFAGKKIGAVYGNEEDEYNGEYRMRPRMKWFCSYDAAPTAKIPEAKYIKKPAAATVPSGMTVVEEDDDLPF